MVLDFATVSVRLSMLGYTTGEADQPGIEYWIELVSKRIFQHCNIKRLSDDLIPIVVDMVCGEFLYMKKASGLLPAEFTERFTGKVKQVSEGDTTVVMAVGASEESQFDAFVQGLIKDSEKKLSHFRRVKWD